MFYHLRSYLSCGLPRLDQGVIMQQNVTFGMLIVLLGIVGCTGRMAKEERMKIETEKRGEPLSIAFGEQGGVTGGYSGHTIDEKGNVVKISRLPGGRTREDSSGTVSSEALDALKSFLETSGFFRIEYGKRGNMTYSVQVRNGDLQHRVFWPAGDASVPEVLMRTWRDLNALVKTAK